jgi:predicted phage terminase large subunit-like protein
MAHARLVHRDSEGRPLVPARHHYEWVRVMEARDLLPWVVVVAPPGFAKSTWYTWAYSTWRIGASRGASRIGIVANAATQASAWVAAVGDAVDSAPFRAAYPRVRPDRKRGWGKGKFFVTGAPAGPNPTCLASGIGGVSVLGKRFDEVVLDDPTTWENARSQTVMEGQRHWLKTTLISRFPPGTGPPEGVGGRMVVVLTRWSEQDLVPTLRELGFTVIRMPALGYWDGQGDPSTRDFVPGDEPLWPEQMSKGQLEALRDEDPIVFQLVMQGNAQVLSGDTFDPSWFQHGVAPPRASFDRVVQYADTAGGRDRTRGDFFCLATIGRITGDDGKPQWWVLDVKRERLSSLQQEDVIKRQAMIWEVDEVVVEDANEGRAIYDRLRADTTFTRPLRRYVPTRDKEFRALPLAAAYRSGRVWHPANAEGVTERWVRSFEAELEAFPESPHDDQVDAAAGAFNSMTRKRLSLRTLR